jgi:hypothetical protein
MGLKTPSVRRSYAASSNSSNSILHRFFLLSLPVALTFTAGTAVWSHFEIKSELAQARSSEATAVDLGVKEGISSIRHELQVITSDLALMAIEGNFIELISGGGETNYEYVLSEWLTFAGVKNVYDQIRWIDLNGQERMRVNRNRRAFSVVPEDQLQNKARRYYFADTLKLNRGEFFISPLDLNIEQGKIETPRKPMIRIGTPVFDRAGKKQGILILNYLAENMLRAFSEMMGNASSRSWLVNRDGFWLKGPSFDLEWGFMYQRPEASLINRDPDAWSGILASSCCAACPASRIRREMCD